MIHIGDLEADLHEKCNLKCTQCSHSSPHASSDDEIYALDQFRNDLCILSNHLKCKVFRIVGGEPLLNKNLLSYIHEIRKSNICDKLSLFTNGLLIQKVDKEIFKNLDEIRVSVYELPDNQHNIIKENLDFLKQFSKLNVEFNHIKTFLAFNIIEKNKDANLVKNIFDNCYHKKDSYSVFNGKLYRCFAARKKYNFLHSNRDKVRDNFENLKNNRNDYIFLDSNLSSKQLKDFLFSEKPLDACAWCLGCSGRKIKNIQIKNSKSDYLATLNDLNFLEGKSYVSNCLLSWHRNRVDQLKGDSFYNYEHLKSYIKYHSTNF
jgi:uncharacterized Fe-S cluster-containing radical SAM superfamily protein